MKNMKVSTKLITSFLIVIALAVTIGIIGFMGMRSINQSATDLYVNNTIAIKAMGDLREIFATERNDFRNIFLNQNDIEQVNKLMANFTDYDKKADESFLAYEKTITDNSKENGYFTAKNAWYNEFATMKDSMWKDIKLGNFDAAYETFNTASPIIAPIIAGFADSAEQNAQWASDANDDTDALYATLSIVLVLFMVAAVVVSLVLSFYISGLITNPLIVLNNFMKKAGTTGDISLEQTEKESIAKYSLIKDEIGQCIASTANFIKHLDEISEALTIIANGDLTAKSVKLSDSDTMGVSLLTVSTNLNQMFSEINAASSQVATGAEQVATGSQSLAQGSTEQASSVEQLSASISEVSDKTKRNADMANEAATLSNEIKDNAEKGSKQMDHLMQAVTEINEASQSISKVIKVIDDIAFQTNILALNAAVEAARAGQHGKGFAVVAEEVRTLASKSAEAAKDTGHLIENSMEKANFGLSIATETATSLTEIIEGINYSAEIVTAIAQSSNEQTSAISQINTGIEQVSQVVQQNSATAEESAAASEEMSGQSSLLQGLISQFKLLNDSNNYTRNNKSSSRSKKIDLSFDALPDNGDYGKY